MTAVLPRRIGFAPHFLAAIAGLFYAYAVFRSPFVRTALQFVGPLLVILLSHLAWIVAFERPMPDIGHAVMRRTAQTAVGLGVAVLLVEIVAPMPSEAAGGGDWLSGTLMVLACLLIVALVVGVVGLILLLCFRLIEWLIRLFATGDDRASDLGSLAFVVGLLVVASVEGLPDTYGFDGSGEATAFERVAAAPDAVWAAMGTATSAAYPLPPILRSLPQPVAVSIDEGVGLGANRVVRIAGREGEGDLSLRVTERGATRVRFTVLSDTSPMANWVAFRAVVYEVTPDALGAKLGVTIEYDNRLAPAWFFGPLVDGAAWLAAGVLAGDTAQRAAN